MPLNISDICFKWSEAWSNKQELQLTQEECNLSLLFWPVTLKVSLHTRAGDVVLHSVENSLFTDQTWNKMFWNCCEDVVAIAIQG